MSRDPATESRLLAGILALLVLYTLYFASSILFPITLAILLSLLLAPVVRALTAVHVPRAASAAVVLLLFLSAVGGAGFMLAEPAGEWARKAPQFLRQAEIKLRSIKQPIEEVKKATDQIEELAGLDEAGGGMVVEVEPIGLVSSVLAGAPAIAAGSVVTLILLVFLLSSGGSLLHKLIGFFPEFGDRRRALAITRKIQRQIAWQLMTITAINGCLGLVVALAMYLLGMPNPLLWGAMAGLLNFAPYIGAAVTAVVLALVALLSFDGLAHAALVPAVFVAISALEGQLVTPAILGRSLSLSPVIVFLSIILWAWLWGIAGALIAVPLLTSVKVCCEQVPSLAPVARFLGR